jgi:acyl carrier protein
MSENYQEPRTDLERNIQSIWQEVLEIKKIGVDENFFNIGGDSLNVMKVYGRIDILYPKSIKSLDIFLYPTISKLVKIIEKNIKKNKM